MRAALASVARWRQVAGEPLWVSVNVTPAHLEDAGPPDRVGAMLAAHGPPGDALVLEITEQALIADVPGARHNIAALSRLGVEHERRVPGRDPWLEAIAAYAARPQHSLVPAVQAAALDRIVDTVGCALGAGRDPAPSAALSYAGQGGPFPLWGTRLRAGDPYAAALANGVLVRYLDANDAYHGVEPIHPSDVIAAVLTAARLAGVAGPQAVDGIATAYEVAMTAADAIAPTPRGFDHVNVTMLGAVAGCARVLGLSERQAAHAVAIAVTSHVALRQTRTGVISMWNAYAAADACRHALYATHLAAAGVAGPHLPFVGKAGVLPLVLGLPAGAGAAPALPLDARVCSQITRSQVKPYPCGSTIQAPAHAALRLLDRGVTAGDIARVDIHVGPEACALHAGPDKLHPRSRETADHSIPFVVASILARGQLSIASFDEAAVADPTLHAFLDERVRVIDDPALDGGHDHGFPSVLEVTCRDGSTIREAVEDPPGSPGRPLTDEELAGKFRELAARSELDDAGAAAWQAVRGLSEPQRRIEDVEEALAAA